MRRRSRRWPCGSNTVVTGTNWNVFNVCPLITFIFTTVAKWIKGREAGWASRSWHSTQSPLHSLPTQPYPHTSGGLHLNTALRDRIGLPFRCKIWRHNCDCVNGGVSSVSAGDNALTRLRFVSYLHVSICHMPPVPLSRDKPVKQLYAGAAGRSHYSVTTRQEWNTWGWVNSLGHF